jgi:hypothetical protein
LFFLRVRRDESRPKIGHLLSLVFRGISKAGAYEPSQADRRQHLFRVHLLDPKRGDAFAEMRPERGAFLPRAGMPHKAPAAPRWKPMAESLRSPASSRCEEAGPRSFSERRRATEILANPNPPRHSPHRPAVRGLLHELSPAPLNAPGKRAGQEGGAWRSSPTLTDFNKARHRRIPRDPLNHPLPRLRRERRTRTAPGDQPKYAGMP